MSRSSSPSDLVSQLMHFINDPTPRPGLHPIPGTKPLTVEAILLPPLLYYLALLFLPCSPPPAVDSFIIRTLRNVLAGTAASLFFRLPLAYYIPQSIGLTYQLGLVGLYGGCRVVDAFFISPYLFNHIPKRVHYTFTPRTIDPSKSSQRDSEKEWTNGGLKDHFLAVVNKSDTVDSANGSAVHTPQTEKPATTSKSSQDTSTSYFPTSISSAVAGPEPQAVYESARTEQSHPTTFLERAAWALELELAMRGTGFTWTTADVRHTRKTWLPTVANRAHSILVHVLPVLVGGWAIIRAIYTRYLAIEPDLFLTRPDGREVFDANLPFSLQLVLTLALGAFLMAAFSLAHSMFAIVCAPLAPSPLAFFPPLYTMRAWRVTSVRQFWSFGWHRLFARLFLVYGVWPGEFLERKLLGKSNDQPADVGKVIGAFLSSAFVHSFAARGVMAGDWLAASGEARFFALNGLAVAVEEVVKRVVRRGRRSSGRQESAWYDAWVGRVWWLGVLLVTGRNFARGWVKSGLVREMAFT